jgi:hypothetical protein
MEHAGLMIDGVGDDWRHHDLAEGERVRGKVLRIPTPFAFMGTRLFLETADGVLALPATAKRGHTLLDRAIQTKDIQPGDHVEVEFYGWSETQNGERRYRHEEIHRIEEGA